MILGQLLLEHFMNFAVVWLFTFDCKFSVFSVTMRALNAGILFWSFLVSFPVAHYYTKLCDEFR